MPPVRMTKDSPIARMPELGQVAAHDLEVGGGLVGRSGQGEDDEDHHAGEDDAGLG